MATPLPHGPDHSGGWRITDHARARARERGFDLLAVAQAAAYPEDSAEQAAYPGKLVHRRGDVAVVLDPDRRAIVTVLHRDRADWTPGAAPPAPPRTQVRESSYVRPEVRDPEVRRRKLQRDPGLDLADARRMLAQGYALDHVVRLTGYPPEALVVTEAAP